MYKSLMNLDHFFFISKRINMTGQRKHERYSYEAEVQVKFDTGDVFTGKLINFSLGGAFIVMETLPKFGSKVKVSINLPGVPERSEIPCFVRWINEGEGMGMQFEYLRPIEVWALTKLIKKLK
jgi:hypothetical protein